MSQLNPVHTLISYFLRMRFSITLPYTPTSMSPKWDHFRLSISDISHACYNPNPFNSSWFYHRSNIWSKEYKSWSISVRRPKNPSKSQTACSTSQIKLYGNLLLATRPTPQLEDLTTSAVRGSYMNHRFLQELPLKSIGRWEQRDTLLTVW
jgi:hypothetical protein